MSDGADGDDADGGTPDDAEFQANFASPEARAEEARNSALDAFSQIDPDDPNTSKVDALKAEQDTANTWAKHAAVAKEEGHPAAHIDAHAGQLAAEADHYTKGNLTGLVDEQSQRLRKAKAGSSSGSGPDPLDEWIEAHLDRVVRVETTDHVQSTVYRWDFDEGTVETAKTKDGVTHFSWSHFRDEIYDGLGVNTTKPNRREAEEWRTWIAELMDQRGDTRETFGPRSTAVEKVQEFVRDSVAFGNKSDAVERNGVYLDDSPNSSPGRLCVMGTDIKRICDDCEIEVRGLQQELDARGHTHDDVNGVSEGEYVNGSNIRYWVLNPDFATPAGYMEEAQSPADSVAEQESDDSTNATPTSVQPNVGDDGSKLSSIGPDGDEADETSAEAESEGDGESDENSAQEHAQDRKERANGDVPDAEPADVPEEPNDDD